VPDLIVPLAFGLFLLVAAWRAWRAHPRYGLIAMFVVVSYVTLQGWRYVHLQAARRNLAELTPDKISGMELDGRRVERAEDIAAVVRCLRDAEGAFTHRSFSREVPLLVTLADGSVHRYDLSRALNGSGARIHDVRQSAYSFSGTLPQALSRASAPLP